MQSQQMKALIAAKRENPYTPDQTVEQLRSDTEKRVAANPPADDTLIQLVAEDGVHGEWIDAPGVATDRVFYFMHGGGYYRGTVASSRAGAAALSRACGARCFSLEYRLAPEHPFPAAHDDALAAYRWLLEQGFAAEKIVVGGISAGGGLAIAMLLALRDNGEPLPAAAVPLSPWLDLTQSGDSFQRLADQDPFISRPYLDRMAAYYAAGADVRQPYLSPLFGELTGLPPMLLHVGAAETMLDESLAFVERCSASGVDLAHEIWPDVVHGWHAHVAAPEAQAAVGKVGEFFKRMTD